MLRAFKLTALPDEQSSPILFRCCEDRLLPTLSIFKIPCNADQINGSEILVIFSHMGIGSWTGKNVTKELRALTIKCILDARDIISLNSGNTTVPIMAYEQGEAPQEFWNLLQISSEPHEIPTESVRFTDPILQCLNEPIAHLDLSSTMSNRVSIAVIGGGATGVFCARQMLAPLYKQYLNISITLFEKSDSIGGMASKPGDYEAGCPFFTARSAEFKEFTRKSFESGYVQPLDLNVGIGEVQENAFRTFRYAAPSFESAEDQDYIYKKSTNPVFYPLKSSVPFFYPGSFLPPADCFSEMRKDTDPRTAGQKPAPKPNVNRPDFLFHEAHSLSQSMSAGNLWTGRLWRGHRSMSDWFNSLLIDSRMTIKLGTEITNIERLQKRGGGVKVYGFAEEFDISIKLTKNISKMMHLALAHSYQNDKDPKSAFGMYHQEVVVEFHPPIATTLDMLWLESRSVQHKEQFGLSFAFKDSSRQRLFSTGVDRMRGHNDRVVSMAKGYSYSTPQSHPVGGGHSSVAEGDTLRDVWVLYSERGWNCLGPIGFHFVKKLNDFKSNLQQSITDQQHVIKRCFFFVKQCRTQTLRWQMLVQENDVRTSDYQEQMQQEFDAYDIKIGTLMQMKETSCNLQLDLQGQLELLASNLETAEASKHQLEETIPQIEKEVIAISIEILSLENDLNLTQDAAARCRLDLLAQEDKISSATQQFDRDAIVDAAIESQYSSTYNPDLPLKPNSRTQLVEWDQDPAVASLLRLDSDVTLDQDYSFRNEEIADDYEDYLMHKSAKEAREKLEEHRLRRENERLMQDELFRLLNLSQSAERIVVVQKSKLSELQSRLASSSASINDMKKALQSIDIDLQNFKMRSEDITARQNKITQQLEFLHADEIALRVEILKHQQGCHHHMQTLQLETEVLKSKLVEAHKKHDIWSLRQHKATGSLDILQQYIDQTSDALLIFDSELKFHSAGVVKQLCKDAIQVCEQSIYANLRECDSDTIVHYFGQRNIGLNSAELRKSKSNLIRYLAEFGAESLLILNENSFEPIHESATNEPAFVQRLWSQFLDLKTKYADFVLGNLVMDQDDNHAADDLQFVEESPNDFIQVVGDKIHVDSKSDDFSPLSLLRLATKLSKTCNLNSKDIILEMLASDFDQMFTVIRKYFHEYVTIISDNEDSDHDLRANEYSDDEIGNLDDDYEEEFDEEGQSDIDDSDDDIGGFFDDDEVDKAGFFRDSDDDSDFMDDLSLDRRKRYKVMRKMSASSVVKDSGRSHKESKEISKLHSSASQCFDGSSLFDFHTKVCVCGNWLIDASIEGAFLSGSGGAHRLMQSIEDDPVMLARLGEDAIANALYSEDLQLRAHMVSKMQQQITLRRMAQRSNLRPQQSLSIIFQIWRRIAIKGRLLSALLKRIKNQFFNMCLIRAFSTWANATDDQWALQFSAILQWTRTLKSRAFVQWCVISKKISDFSQSKTMSRLFDLSSDDSEDIHIDEAAHVTDAAHDSVESNATFAARTAVPLHTDLSNLNDWCRCPLPPFSWTSEDELCLKLPDISGSTDSDLAFLAKDFLKKKPTKQSEYIFRLGWLLYWYRDNNEFAPKSLAAKMALWEEKHLGLSPDISGQVLYFYKMCTLFPLCRRLSWRKDHIMEKSRTIFQALMQFQKQDPTACVAVWGEPDCSPNV